jgi:hypothetical protein
MTLILIAYTASAFASAVVASAFVAHDIDMWIP